MRRLIFSVFAAGLTVALSASVSSGLMIAVKSPAQRALTSETVVIGKVTAIEKEMVEATPFPGAPNKLQYKIAVVKIETALSGSANVTHIKVGFIPPPPPMNPQPGQPGVIRPGIRRPAMLPELKEGEEYVLFLSKHPDGNFLMMSNMSPPLENKAEGTKNEVESIKKVLAVVAEPVKSLKADKADDRAFAAAVLATKYRSYPDRGGETEQTPISADESKLILKGLAESDWTKFDRAAPNGMQAFYSLGLTDKDGWVAPKPVPAQQGQPAPNFNQLTKDAFIKWLDGPGKDYQIKQIVPKKK
jgi:hypothetical protein